jgi:tRNA1(Val) A37 N6-methylase TrmN6
MEYLHNGFTLELAEGSFPLSTDSVLLADFVRLPKNASVLDLGSGCGTLGLMLCAKDPACAVTGIEQNADDHQMALQNAQRNGISHRFESICGDLRSVPDFLSPGTFTVCISNPPYFSGGFQSQTHAAARHADSCPLEALFQAAGWALKFGGDFFLVHKPQMLGQLCHQASRHNLEPKRLKLIRHQEDGPVSLILLQCRKGAKPSLAWEEASLHHPDGTPTDFYRTLYHL